MDILEENQGDLTLEYSQCPKCKCKVAITKVEVRNE